MVWGHNIISIHALLAESDDTSGATYRIFRAFLSTLSLRRATGGAAGHSGANKFLSTLSLRRATSLKADAYAYILISIHALLAETRRTPSAARATFTRFYPRSPCGERRA